MRPPLFGDTDTLHQLTCSRESSLNRTQGLSVLLAAGTSMPLPCGLGGDITESIIFCLMQCEYVLMQH